MNERVMGDIGQWLALIIIVAALIIQLCEVHTLGELLIIVSAIVYGTATKIKYYGSRVLSAWRVRKHKSEVLYNELA